MAKAKPKQGKQTGRPPLSANGSSRVGVKAGVEDRELWERAASAEIRSLSEWCRINLNKAAREQLGITDENAS
jgi:hypothetical protein